MRTAQESVHFVAATIGFVSYAALWVGTLWGSVLRSGWASSRLRHQTVHGIHMHAILLGLTLGIVHGLVQMAAPYGKVRAIDVVVPFGDRADPVGIGLGVLALELMIATALSVLVQRKLGYARWRALHSLGYLSFTMVAAHLLISGTEMYRAPARAVLAGSWAVIMIAGISTVAPVARMPRAVLDRLSPRHRAEEVTVAVDPGRCGSFGFCEQEAPGIFTLRSDQRLAYRSVVGSEQAEPAMRAAAVCPARAIKLGRLPATVVVSQPAADTSTVSPLATTLTPHTGGQPAAPDPHAGTMARMVAAVDPGTGPHPLVPDTGSFPLVATGPQPRLPAPDPRSFPPTSPHPRLPGPDTGPFPRVATGPQPRLPAPDPRSFPRTARQPMVPTAMEPRLPIGVEPGVRTAVEPELRTGMEAGVPSGVGPGVRTGMGAGVPSGTQRRVPAGDTMSYPPHGAGVDPPSGPLPRRPIRAVERGVDPPADEPLPAPDQLQDTGRHHVPRLRGIAGGRS